MDETTAKRILVALLDAGGEHPQDEWERGYDDAISLAIEIVEKITGESLDQILSEGNEELYRETQNI